MTFILNKRIFSKHLLVGIRLLSGDVYVQDTWFWISVGTIDCRNVQTFQTTCPIL